DAQGSHRIFCLVLSEYMVALFQQYTENICFFSNLSAGGLCDWGILLVIPLEFQGKGHQPFSMAQPKAKGP
ncbi:hypothetical protein, partial [uncultured Bilophila sp.]|uniref:hypothetical protein n=1 Tax=uncultured Bilophila sp. TaxID=529385 RepID=UPI0026708972